MNPSATALATDAASWGDVESKLNLMSSPCCRGRHLQVSGDEEVATRKRFDASTS